MFGIPDGVMTSGVYALDVINQVVIVLICAGMFFQMFYSLFFFFKNKTYKPAKNYHKFAVLVCARNEENVIKNMLDSLNKQNYPKDKYDVFVICHNCTDKTKQIAEEMGCFTLDVNDDNPKHHKKGYALNAAFKELLQDKYDHEAYIIFDADNLAGQNFISKMNDAFDSGVKAGQGYRKYKNFEENVITEINGIFHLRDMVFNNKARTLLHSSVIASGTGFYFSREIITALDGWNNFSFIEDGEFSVKLALKDYTIKSVPDAEYYDELPTSLIVSMNRQARMGRGSCEVFFTKAHLLLFKFFTTFKLKYIDMFFNLYYPVASLLACLWFPFYYSYIPIRHLILGNYEFFGYFMLFVLEMICIFIMLPITIQNIICYLMSYKRQNIHQFWKAFGALLFFPIFNLCIAVAVTAGVFTPNFKWKVVEHSSPVKLEDLEKTNPKTEISENK